MLSFVLRKMLNNKWMMACLLIGNILLSAVVASVPIYSDAILNRVLEKTLTEVQTQERVYPGIIEAKTSVRVAEDHTELANTAAALEKVVEELDVPVLSKVIAKNSMKYDLTCLANRKPATSFQGISLYNLSGVEEHIEIIAGRMYEDSAEENVIECVVNQRTMDEEDFLLDEYYELDGTEASDGKPYRIRIVGVFKSAEGDELYFRDAPENESEYAIVGDNDFYELFEKSFSVENRYNIRWRYFLDYNELDASKTSEYTEFLTEAQETLKNNGIDEQEIIFLPTITGFAAYETKLNLTLWVLLVPIFVLLAFFIYMVSQKILESDKNTIAVIKSRGASRLQIIVIFLIQSAVIAAISFIIGIPLGMFICTIVGSSNGFLELVQRTALDVRLVADSFMFTGIAAVFAVLTMVVPVFSYSKVTILDHKRASAGKNKGTVLLLIVAGLALLVSLYGYYSFNNQIQYIIANEDAAMDPLLFLSSSIFIISLGAIIAAVIPMIVRAAYAIGKHRWSPSLYVTFLRVIRAVDGQRSIMIFLVLTIAIGMFSSRMARTINQSGEDDISYTVGADLVLQEKWSSNALDQSADQTVYIEPDYGKYENLMAENEGLTATKVMVHEDYTVGTLKGVTMMGIEIEGFAKAGYMRDGLLPVHWYEYLNAMSSNAGAVIVSENFIDLGYKLGDQITVTDENDENYVGIIYAFVDYWPTYFAGTSYIDEYGRQVSEDNYLVVGNLSQIQSVLGMKPYQVWINADDPNVVYEFAEEYGVSFLEFTDTSAEIVEMKNDPVLQGTNGVLTVGFIIVLAVCMTGFLIYWILSIKGRSLQFGVLRAMGMSMKEIISMLIFEQLFVTVTSIAGGILVGEAASQLFVPVIQLSFSAGDVGLPLQIASNTGDFIKLFATVAVVIAACMAVLVGLIKKIKVAQALKLGED